MAKINGIKSKQDASEQDSDFVNSSNALNQSFETDEAAINYLASILVRGFLRLKRNERNRETNQ